MCVLNKCYISPLSGLEHKVTKILTRHEEHSTNCSSQKVFLTNFYLAEIFFSKQSAYH